MKSIHVQGKPLPDEATNVCVLYEPRSGRVVHIHAVTTLRKERPATTRAHVEERALACAAALGHETERLEKLHVPHAMLRDATPVKVEDKKLIVAKREPARVHDLAMRWVRAGALRAKQAQ